ncbi:MAG: hypothetical protein ACXVCY_04855 [Pseudobdellovibrionaceae bacterium]
MQGFFLLLICVFSVLSGCTSQETALKEQALKQGQIKFAEVTQKEADEAFRESPVYHQKYIDFMRDHSEVVVDKIQFNGESNAVVVVKLKTYSFKIRRTMIDIAASVPASKRQKFNFTDAVSLIAEEKGLSLDYEKTPLTVFSFHKIDNKWVLE